MSSEELLQQKAVQEIAKSCRNNEIPEKFKHKSGYQQSKVDLVPLMDDFVIDLSFLFDSSSPKSTLEFGKLQYALNQWGCFQAINHGLSSDFLDEVREVTKQFFDLPLEEKRKYARKVAKVNDFDGYGNDTVLSETQILDWTDRLYLTVYPDDKQKLEFWPEKPLAFRKVMNEYTMKLRTMFEPLLKAMARCLSLDEDCFVKEHGESVVMAARFGFYPQCHNPESVLGLKPHADGTTMTMLLQDKQTEGLQVLKDDQWFRVPVIPDALFINLGDLLEATNHGLSSAFLDEVREVTKQFFDLPIEEKQKYARDISDLDGYGNDTVVSETQIIDWTDRLFLTVYPEGQQKLQFWPEKPLAFRKVINEFIMKLRMMFEPLLKAMARCLSLDEDCFVKEHGESVIMAARFNFYPQCPDPESVLGVKPHADGTAVTMLLQDKEVEGLQVLKDDQWFRVPVVPDALFINLGDLLEIMSNGILKSPVHRVVTNSDRERISVAVFCFPDPNIEVGPVADLITDEQPQMYQRVRHYENIFFKYYQLGQRPLHAVRM